MSCQKLKVPKGYSIAVLHAHSTASDGMVTPTQLVADAAQTGIKVLALTDHDTLSGIDQAKKAGKRYGVEIIVGEEIQTKIPRVLHIIGLFLKEKIPHNKSPLETIRMIHQQGGLAIVPHPFSRLLNLVPTPTASIQQKDLFNILKYTHVDGIEIKYPSITQTSKLKLISFYRQHAEKLGAQIGSSDSHFGSKDLLTNYTLFPGKTDQDLFWAIKNKKTRAIKGQSHPIPKKDLILQNLKSLTLMSAKRYLPFIDY